MHALALTSRRTVAVFVALWALHQIAAVVLLLIAAALFASVIAPLVQLAEHPIRVAGRSRRLPRVTAIGAGAVLGGLRPHSRDRDRTRAQRQA